MPADDDVIAKARAVLDAGGYHRRPLPHEAGADWRLAVAVAPALLDVLEAARWADGTPCEPGGHYDCRACRIRTAIDRALAALRAEVGRG